MSNSCLLVNATGRRPGNLALFLSYLCCPKTLLTHLTANCQQYYFVVLSILQCHLLLLHPQTEHHTIIFSHRDFDFWWCDFKAMPWKISMVVFLCFSNEVSTFKQNKPNYFKKCTATLNFYFLFQQP